MPSTMFYFESAVMNQAHIIPVLMDFVLFKQGFGYNSYLSNEKRRTLIKEHID